MKVKLYKLKDAEKFKEELLKSWPQFLPVPKVEYTDELICDGEPFIVVSDEVTKVEDCASLWAKPDPQDVIIKFVELNYALTEKGVNRRTFITGKQIEKFVKIPVINSNCLSSIGCNQCVISCPQKALSIVEGKVVIDENKCTYCGLCSASCPIGAINLSYPNWTAITMLTKVVKKNKISISCDPKSADFLVPCLGVLGPEELYALHSFYDIELICPNEKCVNRQAALHAIDLYKEIKEKMKVKPNTFLSGNKRSDYVRIITAANISGESSFDIHAYKVSMNNNCTLCGACIRKCPTKSLKYNVKDSNIFIEFTPSKCVGCNKCVNVCEEDAITVNKSYDYSSLHEDTFYITAEDEVVRCKRCGRPFDNKKKILRVASLLNVDHSTLEYCNECKQTLIAEKILSNWKEKFGEIRRSKLVK